MLSLMALWALMCCGSRSPSIPPSHSSTSPPRYCCALAALEIADIDGGSYIHKLIECIVQPPTTFWGAFLHGFQANQLQPDAQESFAWLLLQVVILPDNTEYDGPTISLSIIKTLLHSRFSVRSIAAKIKHVAIQSGSNPRNESLNGPGGRHDNDHVEFCQISILPTASELESISMAFLQPSRWLEDPVTENNRLPMHLDNQFRLLREG